MEPEGVHGEDDSQGQPILIPGMAYKEAKPYQVWGTVLGLLAGRTDVCDIAQSQKTFLTVFSLFLAIRVYSFTTELLSSLSRVSQGCEDIISC